MDDSSTSSLTRNLWLDKLWSCLFDDGSGGLLSPGQIRREHRDRNSVRELELSSIDALERDIQAVHEGVKTINDKGELVDSIAIESVSTHRIIENSAIEQDLDVAQESSEAMIRSAVNELSVRDLERSLNVRKIAILAENEIHHICDSSAVKPISSQNLSSHWVSRWREFAETVVNSEMQALWAKVIVSELAKPGTVAVSLFNILIQLNEDDIQVLKIMSKYTFPDFIADANQQYFGDSHRQMFDQIEELGLVSNSSKVLSFKSNSTESFNLILPCGDKAIQVRHEDPNKVLSLHAFKLSRAGRQLFPVIAEQADSAYLFSIAQKIKQEGFKVELGEWKANQFGSVFESRLAI